MGADEIYQIIKREKIIAIVRGVKREKILNVAKALYDGGIKMMEITCNTQDFAEMISDVREKMNGKMIVGAGTVITKSLCGQALDAGAKYIVAPDVNPEVIKHCLAEDIAVLPGAATATEVLTAVRQGAEMIKIFPAEAIGVDYIKQLRGPIDNVVFVAVGGVTLDNVGEFMTAGCVGIAIGGGVICKEFIEDSDWGRISAVAKQYVDAMSKF